MVHSTGSSLGYELNTCHLFEPAGLVFYDPQPRSPSHAEASLGLLFALQLVWALFPFMYTAFLQADRQYYATDAANGLYRPSVCSGLWGTCKHHNAITLGYLLVLSECTPLPAPSFEHPG